MGPLNVEPANNVADLLDMLGYDPAHVDGGKRVCVCVCVCECEAHLNGERVPELGVWVDG
jgi:hypothetical protein